MNNCSKNINENIEKKKLRQNLTKNLLTMDGYQCACVRAVQ